MVPPDDPSLIPFRVAGIILLGIVFWSLILFILGRIGGWSRLAESYRSSDEMPSTRWRFQTGQFRGWVNYGSCLTVGVDHRGLHFASFGPLLGHPPLLIPWTDVTATPKKTWWTRCADFRFRQAPEISILVNARLAERIASSAAGFWPRGQGLATGSGK